MCRQFRTGRGALGGGRSAIGGAPVADGAVSWDRCHRGAGSGHRAWQQRAEVGYRGGLPVDAPSRSRQDPLSAGVAQRRGPGDGRGGSEVPVAVGVLAVRLGGRVSIVGVFGMTAASQTSISR